MSRGITYEDLRKMELSGNAVNTKNEEHRVYESCNNCCFEVELVWNVETDGYKIFCPNCGKEMMLCEMCKLAKDNRSGYCDFRWTNKEKGEGICFRRLEQMLKTAYAEKDLNEGKCGK